MIRRAVPADTDKIMSLWFRENAAAHSFIPRRFWENCAEMVRTELLPAAETFVFCDKRQIKGFISLLNGDYVGALFVREDCQGKGIGLRLLEYVRRRRPRLSLHAYIRNAGAMAAPMLLASFTPRSVTVPMVQAVILGPVPWLHTSAAPEPVTVHWAVGVR